MSNIPTKPTSSDYTFWRHKPNNSIVLTASGTVKLTDGIFSGYFVSSHSSGTVKFWNSAAGATGTVLIDTIAIPALGVQEVPETYFSEGLYVTIGNTATLTVFYK